MINPNRQMWVDYPRETFISLVVLLVIVGIAWAIDEYRKRRKKDKDEE